MIREYYKNHLEISWLGVCQVSVSGNIKWDEIEAMLVALGAEVSEREGSRVVVVLFDEVRVFHRPHPLPETDKGAVASIRKWLESNGMTP